VIQAPTKAIKPVRLLYDVDPSTASCALSSPGIACCPPAATAVMGDVVSGRSSKFRLPPIQAQQDSEQDPTGRNDHQNSRSFEHLSP